MFVCICTNKISIVGCSAVGLHTKYHTTPSNPPAQSPIHATQTEHASLQTSKGSGREQLEFGQLLGVPFVGF